MKLECKHCKEHDTCSFRGRVCDGFTCKPEYLEERANDVLNEKRKTELFEHFFYTMRGYLDKYGKYNTYENMKLYYSLDQDMFLKRHALNKKDKGNWIELDIDVYKFIFFKEKFGYDDPRKSIGFDGRTVGYTRMKDDIFLAYLAFIEETFDAFFEKNKRKDKVITHKKLF